MLSTALSAHDAFCLQHYFETGLTVSSGVGSFYESNEILPRSHKPFAVGRSVDPIRVARRSLNYSFAKGAKGLPLVDGSVTIWWQDKQFAMEWLHKRVLLKAHSARTDNSIP